MNTPSSYTPGKPRWGMRILFGFFAALTAVGILASFSDANNLPGVCFFGVLAAMFFVLAKSPKDKPCIFGREQGAKKSVFVIGCVAAAFVLMVIAAPPLESNTTPSKPESATAAPVERPAEPPAPQPAPAPQQAELAPAPPVETQPQPEEKPAPTPVEPICNIEQFGGISGEELIALLGKPDEIGEDELDMFGVPAMRYKYDNDESLGRVEFVLVDDKVVYMGSMKRYPYHGKEKVFEQFGIKRGKDCVTVTDMPSALCYECPSDKIDSIRLNSIEKDSFLLLTVHYDMRLLTEWHITPSLDDKCLYQVVAERAIKGILKSPKSADFPSLNEWRFGANRFYAFASSYVDARNAFNAEIRSSFTVILFSNSKIPVYIEFDGKEVFNEGYISMAEVKARTAEKHAKGKKKK